MFGEKNSVTLSQGDPPKTFYYPHDPKKTGSCDDYPPAYLLKETSRLTDKDFIKGKKLNSVKLFKKD